MPKAISTRAVATFWWLFCLILVASYTANLAAFLTKNKLALKIQSADDLVKQTKVNYGCYQNGTTREFFSKSNISTFAKMNSYMMDSNNVHNLLQLNNTKAVEKVLNTDYAYLMESPPLRYELTKNCKLIEIGQELNSLMYSVALPKGSPYTRDVSNTILRLKENQVILKLRQKWWEEDSSKCTSDQDKTTNSNQLQLSNFIGVFLILACLIGLAFLVLILEFCVGSYKDAVANKTSLCRELAYNCGFSIRCCKHDEKPVHRTLPDKANLKHSDSDYLERSLDRLSLSLGSLNTSIAAVGASERATLLSRSLPASRYDSLRMTSAGSSTTPRFKESVDTSAGSSQESLNTTRETNTTVINTGAPNDDDGLSTTITSTAL